MKEFRFAPLIVAGSTMTVGELREFLLGYPDDMPVFAAWEGVEAYIRPGWSRVKVVDKGMEADACPCLVFDVEQY